MQWLDEDEKFSENYTRARENAADADADIITDIREQVVAGTIAPDVARVAIDAAKWSAGKRKPKKYGDKLDLNTTVSGEIKIIVGGDAQ